MKLTVCAASDIGLSRSRNEDTYLCDRDNALFLVADGMGGHAAGDVASRIAAETALEVCRTKQKKEPLKRITLALKQANKAVIEAAKKNSDWRGMGTTLSMLQIEGERAYLAHVGDSRIYLLRAEKLQQLTNDHTVIATQVRRGITLAEHARGPAFGQLLTQAIGLTDRIDVCRCQFALETGDRLLLCSDGLTKMVTDDEISTIMQQPLAVERLCRSLIKRALTCGGKDNVTAILIQVEGLS